MHISSVPFLWSVVARCRNAGGKTGQWLAGLVAVVLLGAGCASPQPTALTEADLTPFRTVTLREGDLIRLTFPGSPNLNTPATVRRDGKVTLALVGDVVAVGKTPAQLEKEILKLYEAQLVTNEVTVTLETPGYPVFVVGAVLKPGRQMAERPVTALESIVEAGGFMMDRANMKAVVVIRKENESLRHYILDLKSVLNGKSTQMFYLRPMDIVYVPERSF
jgi:polysaccharide export outer membrane protein